MTKKDYGLTIQRQWDMVPYTPSTQLEHFAPLPKNLLHLDLSIGAMVVYALLLDRGSLSRKSGWYDEDGWVYVIYTVGRLAMTLRKGESTIKRWLRELEEAGLIYRDLFYPGAAARTYLYVPHMTQQVVQAVAPQEGERDGEGAVENELEEGTFPPGTVQTLPPSKSGPGQKETWCSPFPAGGGAAGDPLPNRRYSTEIPPTEQLARVREGENESGFFSAQDAMAMVKAVLAGPAGAPAGSGG